jgi:hypothetical protein
MFEYFNKSPRKTSNLQMLCQFRDTMQANLLSVPQDAIAQSPTMEALFKKTQQVLDAKDFTWAAAYQAEKMLAHIRPKESLKIEITKQISALEKVDPTAAALFTKELEDLAEPAASEDQAAPLAQDQDAAGADTAPAPASPPAPADQKPENDDEGEAAKTTKDPVPQVATPSSAAVIPPPPL